METYIAVNLDVKTIQRDFYKKQQQIKSAEKKVKLKESKIYNAWKVFGICLHHLYRPLGH